MKTWFRIAETLGCHSVEHWKKNISSKEFRMWQAYFFVDRANYNQADINLAHLCSMFFNSNSKEKISPLKFLPYLEEEIKEQNRAKTQEEFDKKAMAWAKALEKAKGF